MATTNDPPHDPLFYLTPSPATDLESLVFFLRNDPRRTEEWSEGKVLAFLASAERKGLAQRTARGEWVLTTDAERKDAKQGRLF